MVVLMVVLPERVESFYSSPIVELDLLNGERNSTYNFVSIPKYSRVIVTETGAGVIFRTKMVRYVKCE